jgi:glycosyltransferase involved in cell wall biosynthesis
MSASTFARGRTSTTSTDGSAVRIAVIGPLEFPGRQGGMTRHIEEVYARLAADGNDVTVYTRRALDGPEYRGMRVRTVPAVPASPWDRVSYSALASTRAAASRFDVVHYHSYSNSGWCFIPRAAGAKVLMTVHRLEWQDEKWGPAGRAVLQANAWVTHRVAGAFIAVSPEFEEYLRGVVPRGRAIVRIPNGVTVPDAVDDHAAEHVGLAPDGFVLAVSRLVPEKGIDVLLDALDLLAGDADGVAGADGAAALPVAVAGRARNPTAYSRDLEARAARSRVAVHLLGVQPSDVVHGLYQSARAFVAPSRAEGNPLTVIEAMAHGACIVASDIPPHRELLGDAGVLVPVGDATALADALRWVGRDAAAARAIGRQAQARLAAADEYQWDGVASRTAEVLASL